MGCLLTVPLRKRKIEEYVLKLLDYIFIGHPHNSVTYTFVWIESNLFLESKTQNFLEDFSYLPTKDNIKKDVQYERGLTSEIKNNCNQYRDTCRSKTGI